MPAIPDKLADLSDVTGTPRAGKAPIHDGTNFALTATYTQEQADTLLAAKASTGSNTFTGSQTVPSGSSFIAMNGGDWSGVAITGSGVTGRDTLNGQTWSIASATGVATFNGGLGSTALNGSNISSGTVAAARLPTTITLATTFSATTGITNTSTNGQYLGNGSEVRIKPSSGIEGLRIVSSTSWLDTATSIFFQMGSSGGNGTVTSLNANKFPRLNWLATGTQFIDCSHGDSQSILPAPTKNLETGKLTASGDAGSFGILGRSTTTGRMMSSFDAAWASSTDASRTSRVVWNVFDTSAREAMRVESNGSASMLGFYGSSAVAKQSITGSRGGNAALADLLTKLATLGLITDSTTA